MENPFDAVKNSDELHGNREGRRRVGDFPWAFVAEGEVAQGHVQWWDTEQKARWGASERGHTQWWDPNLCRGGSARGVPCMDCVGM